MELTLEIITLAMASGVIVGLFLGIFGGGGSVLAAPLLLYVVGVSNPHLAIGTSAAAVAAIALFNLFGHWRGGRIKWPCASVFAATGLLGSLIGSSLAKMIDGDTLLIGFAIAMALIGLSMFRKPKTEGNPNVTLTRELTMKLAPLGLIVGLAAGFFGIGGGFLIVPGLMLAAGMTFSNATASSLVSVAIFGTATSANYALSGWVDYHLLSLMLIGGIIGGLIGNKTAKKMNRHVGAARKGFAGLIILVAGYVGLNAI